jgi:hypothetical protein
VTVDGDVGTSRSAFGHFSQRHRTVQKHELCVIVLILITLSGTKSTSPAILTLRRHARGTRATSPIARPRSRRLHKAVHRGPGHRNRVPPPLAGPVIAANAKVVDSEKVDGILEDERGDARIQVHGFVGVQRARSAAVRRDFALSIVSGGVTRRTVTRSTVTGCHHG